MGYGRTYRPQESCDIAHWHFTEGIPVKKIARLTGRNVTGIKVFVTRVDLEKKLYLSSKGKAISFANCVPTQWAVAVEKNEFQVPMKLDRRGRPRKKYRRGDTLFDAVKPVAPAAAAPTPAKPTTSDETALAELIMGMNIDAKKKIEMLRVIL